ncbi:hypothetical protein D3C86_2170250 [compost metagenome]
MYGKPMISCEIGTGTSYINRPGETGLVVPPGDPQTLKKAMKLLWDSPEYAATLGCGAAKRFEEIFTAERMVDAYADLYRYLL